MAKAILEIVELVLQEIGRLPGGQSIPADQSKIVKDAYDGLYQELLDDQHVDWASDASIPEKAVYPIVIMLSGRVAFRFGVPNVWATAEPGMMKKISKIVTNPYVPAITEFENL